MASCYMLVSKFNLLLLSFIVCSTLITTSSRPIIPPLSNTTTTNDNVTSSSSNNVQSMMQRLKLEDDETPSSSSVNCWDSMFELQSCTGEVIQFFYEGETYLGPGCCRVIRVIEHHCWPNMLATLGFTSEEGDILEGYCDAEHDDHPQIGN